MAGDRMSQVTHVSQAAYTDDARSMIPNILKANTAAQGWAGSWQQDRECLDRCVRAAGDGVERDCVENPIPGITEHLSHFLSDTGELLEVRLGEQDGRLDNVHSVGSQALLGANTLEVGQQALQMGAGALGSNVSALGWGLRAVGSGIGVLGDRVGEFDLRVDSLDSKVDALDWKVDANHKEAMTMFGQVLASIKELKG
ncbi:hypothetical protein C7212DRAFT_345437 [Tuber magnatum]|uniref:Uncharacterized protein n=1 Tax=Tuber magnatum TaxID=42249 RepID=A0A317SN71_9PEZI|nr:hypothetical protein C7212DRAFT_345437 [Tuber magnatum]